VLVNIFQGGVALNPHSQLLVNQAPPPNYFSCEQQNHKLNGIGITFQKKKKPQHVALKF